MAPRCNLGLVQQQGRQARPPNTVYRVAFGLRLREARESAVMSQEELANRAQMGRRYVGAVERGEVSPTLDRIANLAICLGVQPATLMPPLSEARPRSH